MVRALPPASSGPWKTGALTPDVQLSYTVDTNLEEVEFRTEGNSLIVSGDPVVPMPDWASYIILRLARAGQEPIRVDISIVNGSSLEDMAKKMAQEISRQTRFQAQAIPRPDGSFEIKVESRQLPQQPRERQLRLQSDAFVG